MMKHIWVDAGNDADWEKLQRNGITGEFYAVSDPPLAVRSRLEASRARLHAAGIYGAWNWIDGSGEDFADYMHERLNQIVPAAKPSYPKVQLNNEEHDPDDLLAMLRRWRKHRPTQDTSWTFEGSQAGWMSPEFVAEVLKLKVRLVPQLYRGRMAPIELRDSDPGAFLNALIATVADSHAEVRELVSVGFPEHLISPFYDAAFLPLEWNGFAFTMGRLPL